MPIMFLPDSRRARSHWLALIIVLLLSVVALSATSPQSQPRPGDKPSAKPISKAALLKAVKLAAESTNRRDRVEMMGLVIRQVTSQGLEFQPTAEDESELRAAGASPELLEAVRLKAKEQAELAELTALRDWRTVKESRQAADFENYLKKYPTGEFAPLARERAEQLAWETASASGTAAEFGAFLQKYPESKFAAAARERMETSDWEAIKSGDKIASFETHLKKYPAGKFAALARERAEQLEWDAVKAGVNATDFDAYLKKYPAGKFSATATERLEQLEWEAVKASDKAVDIEAFLQKHPAGKFAASARERKQQLAAPAESRASKQASGSQPQIQRPATGGAAQNKGTIQADYVVWTNEETLSRAISKPPPIYPRNAKEMRVRGMVKVRVVISETGKVTLAEVFSGPNMLRASAQEAALRWTFRPA
ncbi:MAG: TonB family protein, partial [Acidobacteriota bacterium]